MIVQQYACNLTKNGIEMVMLVTAYDGITMVMLVKATNGIEMVMLVA